MKKIKELSDKDLNPVTIYSRLKGRGTCLFERKSDTQDYAIIAFDPVRRLTFQRVNSKMAKTAIPVRIR